MGWNDLYTKRKQKEMTQKAIEYDSEPSDKRTPFYSIYSDRYGVVDYNERIKKEKRRDKIAWMTGYIVMTLLTIVFVCCLVWLV
tara:strand:- start:396 stop:647 length:252 start_codon:yes stop_codon:yes gene_type:complete